MFKLLRFYLFVLLFCSFNEKAFAEFFLVTSNLDNGAGTLREAITKAAANGTSELDYIHFDLPIGSIDDRTILLTSSLPALTSKIVIDGTTQSGAKIGFSNAKVILKTLYSYRVAEIILFSGVDVEQLEFYGLYFLDTSMPHNSGPKDLKRALDIKRGKNIIFGDENKGNVYNGYYGYSSGILIEDTDGFKLADSYLGVSPFANKMEQSEAISLKNVNNLEIGGNNKGNVIFNTFVITFTDKVNTFNIDISHNNVAVYKDGVTTEWSVSGSFFLISSPIINQNDPVSKIDVKIHENLFSHFSGSGALSVGQISGKVNVWRNWFGIDRTGLIPLANKNPWGGGGMAVAFSSTDAEIVFGHDDPALGNIVAYSGGVLNSYRAQNIKIIRNSFKCLVNPAYRYNGDTKIPFVEVLENTDSYVRGKSDPLAIVDVYLSDDCNKSCSPETFIGTTTASANGDWKFDYPSVYTRSVLVNSHVGMQSSDFSIPTINATKVKITDVDCSTTGKIEGIVISNTEKIKWVNARGEVVSTELELKNAIPGQYKLIIGEYCGAESQYFTVQNLTPTISSSNVILKNPSCGNSDGAITNIFAYAVGGGTLSYSWTDQDGKVVSNIREAKDLPAGSYTLTVSSIKCTATFGPVVLKSPDAPSIDLSTLVKVSSSCSSATGSISNIGITANGSVTYLWKDDKGKVVGTERNLLNVSAGKYQLQITDASGCGPVFSDIVELFEINGIGIDDLALMKTDATCNKLNGSLYGLKVSNATSHKWLNEQGDKVSDELDLRNVGAGSYQLIVANSTCTKTYAISIGQIQNQINVGGTTKILKDATCGLNNGRVEVMLTQVVKPPVAFRWKNSTGNLIGGNSLVLEDVDAGEYSLYGIDENGCDKFLAQYTVGRIPVLDLNTQGVKIKADNCETGAGEIEGLLLKGGVTPYKYIWYNDANVQVSSGPTLKNAKTGFYEVQITDALNCTTFKQKFFVGNNTSNLQAPAPIKTVQLCTQGQAIFKFEDLDIPNGNGATYYLYENENSLSPLLSSRVGFFNVDVPNSKSFYVSRAIGLCESTRTEVRVEVGSTDLKIPNTITPNDDGINDEWRLKGIENYPKSTIRIFSRSGEKIYDSVVGYTKPFDGTLKGVKVPVGTYYYIINLGVNCNLITGNLTIIR